MGQKLFKLKQKYRFAPSYYILCALLVNLVTAPHLLAEQPNSSLSTNQLDHVVIESDRQSTDNTGDVFTAFGNVSITYPGKRIFATSQQVQYLKNERIIVLTGNVELVREGRESLHGERVVYFLDEDQLFADSSDDNQVLLKFNFNKETKNVRATSL